MTSEPECQVTCDGADHCRAARREVALIRLLELEGATLGLLVGATAQLVAEALAPALVAVRVGAELATAADATPYLNAATADLFSLVGSQGEVTVAAHRQGIRAAAWASAGAASRRGEVLALTTAAGPFSSADRRFLDAVAHRVARAARDAGREHQIERRAKEEETGHLTSRELQICALIARGATNAEVAAELSLTYGTVANYLGSVRSKLGLKNRVAIAAWTIEQGLGGLDLPSGRGADDPTR